MKTPTKWLWVGVWGVAAGSAFGEGSGGTIAFESRRAGMNVHLIAPDGSGERKLAAGGAPSFSADGKLVAYCAYMNDTNSNDLFVIGADGQGGRRVTQTPEMEQSPALSPDGKAIAFTRQETRDVTMVNDLYIVAADGSGARRLAEGETPAWSPDGTKLAFAAFRKADGDRGEIYVIGADGTGERRVTNDAENDRQPDWSPDGKSLAMASYMDKTKKWDIRVIGADGTGLRRLTAEDGDDSDPAWSPDGTQIAFVSSRDKDGKTEIFVMNADGSGALNVTKNPSWDSAPAWGR